MVIAVAVFDVAKYLLEEEVVRERELRQVGEVRRSLTRFTSTILIAVLLEAIVLIFKVAEDDISLTVYPTLLLFAGVTMLIGLGAFQRLPPRRNMPPASTMTRTTGRPVARARARIGLARSQSRQCSTVTERRAARSSCAIRLALRPQL